MIDISSLKEQIVATFMPFGPEKIILFGSMAREDQDQSSDVDVIVVYHTDKRFMARLKELYLSWNIPKAVDILAYTPSEFNRMVKESSFVHEAVRTGEVIYERS